ncbi:MAG: cyclic nucleotide-binding domain-containing protein [Planctomycetaceae bacterium]
MTMFKQDLSALQIFQNLDDADVGQICEALQPIEFQPGDLILHEGQCIQALWIILDGECIVSRSCKETQERTLATLKSGDVFGEMSFIRTAPHSASIRATTAVKVCCYQREAFLEMAQRRPEAAWRVTANIAAVLAERLRRMDTWVCELVDSPKGNQHRDEWQQFRSAVYTNWDL